MMLARLSACAGRRAGFALLRGLYWLTRYGPRLFLGRPQP